MIDFVSMFKHSGFRRSGFRRSGQLTPAQERGVLALVQSGQEVQAVRLIRHYTDAPLGQAVSLVAGFRQQLTPVTGD